MYGTHVCMNGIRIILRFYNARTLAEIIIIKNLNDSHARDFRHGYCFSEGFFFHIIKYM